MADAAKTPAELAKEQEAAEQLAFETEVKELLKRFGLKKAWHDKDRNLHFDAEYVAKKLDAKKLTLIEA